GPARLLAIVVGHDDGIREESVGRLADHAVEQPPEHLRALVRADADADVRQGAGHREMDAKGVAGAGFLARRLFRRCICSRWRNLTSSGVTGRSARRAAAET